MKIKKNQSRIMAFIMVLVYTFSTFVGGMANTVYASGISDNEIIANDIEVLKGDKEFDIESNFESITFDKEKAKLKFVEAFNEQGEEFNILKPDTYIAIYDVIQTDSISQIERKIIVVEKESEFIFTESEPESKTELESQIEPESQAEPESQTEPESETIDESQNEPDKKARNLISSRAVSYTIDNDESILLGYISRISTGTPVKNYVKYVVNDSASKRRVAYCTQVSRSFDSGGFQMSEWKKNKMYSEIGHAINLGVRYYGETGSSGYSTGNWLKDYYSTQTAIYTILSDNGYDGISKGDSIAMAGYEDCYNLFLKIYNASKSSTVNDGYGEEAYYKIVAPDSVEMYTSTIDGVKYYRTANYKIQSEGDISECTLSLVDAPKGAEIVKASDSLTSNFYIRIKASAVNELNIAKVIFDVKADVKFSRTYAIQCEPVIAGQAVTFLEKTVPNDVTSSKANVSLTPEKAKIEITKKDSKTGNQLPEAVYGVYKDSGFTDLICKVTTNADGKGVATFTKTQDIVYVKELTAPNYYLIDTKGYNVKVICGEQSNVVVSNDIATGQVTVKKVDIDTNKFLAQGNGTLIGARYGIYANKDIYHPDSKTGLLYKQGQLVDSKRIDSTGECIFTNLYLSDYYVQEIEPAEGYLLDATKYPVSLVYEGQTVPIVKRDLSVYETIKKQGFQIIKISEDGEQTSTELIKGAGFSVFLISDLKGVKNGALKPANGKDFVNADFKGYDFKGESEQTAIYYENGKAVKVPELFTDKKGYIKSPEIPYGKYIVVETTIPENLKAVDPFMVVVNEDNREPQEWVVLDDRPYTFNLKIIKKDSKTGKPVLNNSAEYKIFNVDTGAYVEQQVYYPKYEKISVFSTNAEGYLITPEKLKSATYRIEEVKAPSGYLKAKEPIVITVDNSIPQEIVGDKNVIVVEQYNDEQVGELIIHKTGEQLKELKNGDNTLLGMVKTGLKNIVNAVSNFVADKEVFESEFMSDFVYEVAGVEGAEFKVFAKNTIFTPDGQLDKDGNRIVLYEKDSIVEVVKTDKDGMVIVKNLPLGEFYIEETFASKNFVLNPEIKEFSIAPENDEIEVTYSNVDYYNERQKIYIELVKNNSETKEPIQDVIFGLFADSDILDNKGNIIIEKDTLLEKRATDKSGFLMFKADILHGKYRIEELEKKDGYIANDNIWYLDFTYSDQTDKSLSEKLQIENEPTITTIKKTDIVTGNEVEGATLQVIDSDKKIVEEWISSKDEHIIYALPEGDYVLHEKLAPNKDGYVKAQDVPFTVLEDGKIIKVQMKDDFSKLKVLKVDEKSEKQLAGAKLQILKADGKTILKEFVTTDKPEEINYLPVGEKLILREVEAPEGFTLAEDIIFVLEETEKVQEIKMIDLQIKNEPKKEQPKGSNPKTGDNTNLFLWGSLAFISSVSIFYYLKRKKIKLSRSDLR